MATRVGINGFGRIGRQVLKAIRDYYPEELEVVAFNDIGDMKTMAHLLKYDSTYGRYTGTVEIVDDGLLIDGKKVKVFKETDPAAIPWKDLGVDVVVESTGKFTKGPDAAAHLKAGARMVDFAGWEMPLLYNLPGGSGGGGGGIIAEHEEVQGDIFFLHQYLR